MGEVLWYYEDAGQQAGPVGHAAITDAIRTGRLAAGSRVWKAGMAGWQPWEAVPELAAFAPAPPQAAPPMGPQPGYGSPPGQPQGWGAPEASGPVRPGAAPLARVEVGTTVLLSIVTLGLYGLVKFYQCGLGYARLVPGRPSSFERLFWIYLGVAFGGAILSVLFPPLGFVLSAADLVVGILLLGEVLAARDAALDATGARPVLTSAATHKALWIGGAILSFVVVGIFALVAQAVLFFTDHDKLADALARR